MSSDIDKVISCLKYLGLKPDVVSYEWRFLIQKTAYLAQALGIQTSYHFTIYVAGPYSQMLAKDYYKHASEIGSLQSDYKLTSADIECLDKIKACCDIYKNQSLMEATSTIVYLMKENPKLADDDIFAETKSLKPFLGDSLCVIAMSKAKELLFEPRYLTAELKRELKEWDEVED